MEQGVIRNQTEAELAASRLILEQKRVSELKRMLKAYCSEFGNVRIGENVTIGYHKSKSPSYQVTNQAAFDGVLYEHGINPEEVWGLDNSKLKKLMRDADKKATEGNPKLLADLSDCVRPVVKTRFEERKS